MGRVYLFMDEHMSADDPNVIPFPPVAQLQQARDVIAQEAAALSQLAENIGAEFSDAVELIAGITGSVIVTGVGKAGLIGQKIVATLASTGTRSHFLQPTDAVHGDLGCVCLVYTSPSPRDS